MKYFPKISRGNVYLSPINSDDYEIITKWLNDSRITDWTHWTPRLITLQKEKESLQKINESWDYLLAIVKKDSDELLWLTSLFKINRINKTAELWISIWEIEEHNKWYWADAINALLSFAYNTLNLYNICLWVKSFNKKAIACYKKCWFQETWVRHHAEYCNWERYDGILMEMLRPDWEAKNLSK